MKQHLLHKKQQTRKPHIIRRPSEQAAQKEAGAHMGRLLRVHGKKPTLLFVSGGSSLALLNHIPETSLRPNLTVTTLDERITQNRAGQNFEALKKTQFYKRLMKKGARLIAPPQPKNKTAPARTGILFERAIRKWIRTHQNGTLLAVCGEGADGHTAGLFPLPPQHFKTLTTGKLFVSYKAPIPKSRFPLRLTATPLLFKRLTAVLLFATGKNKCSVIEKMLISGPFYKIPARLAKTARKTFIVTDCPIGHQTKKSRPAKKVKL